MSVDSDSRTSLTTLIESVRQVTRAGLPASEAAAIVNPAGTVCGFAPPGDIHRVRNCCEALTISFHIYGADIHTRGSSIRRRYDHPGIARRSCAAIGADRPLVRPSTADTGTPFIPERSWRPIDRARL